MNTATVVGLTAGVVALAGFFPYIKGMFDGTNKPNRISWLIWLILGVILGVTQYILEANTIWVSISYIIGPLIVFPLSLKFGVGVWEAVDKVCLSGAILSLLAWWISGEIEVPVAICLLMHLCGFVLTFKKARLDSSSENIWAWTTFSVANVINLFAISSLTFEGAAYPIYLAISNVLFAGMLLVTSKKISNERVA